MDGFLEVSVMHLLVTQRIWSLPAQHMCQSKITLYMCSFLHYSVLLRSLSAICNYLQCIFAAAEVFPTGACPAQGGGSAQRQRPLLPI